MTEVKTKPIAQRGNFVRYRADVRIDPAVFQVLEENHPLYLVRSLRGQEMTVTADKITYFSKGWFPHAIEQGRRRGK